MSSQDAAVSGAPRHVQAGRAKESQPAFPHDAPPKDRLLFPSPKPFGQAAALLDPPRASVPAASSHSRARPQISSRPEGRARVSFPPGHAQHPALSRKAVTIGWRQANRSEEHTSELQSRVDISYAV